MANTTNGKKFLLVGDKTVTSSHEMVDLGLSVKWATCNIGAENPED